MSIVGCRLSAVKSIAFIWSIALRVSDCATDLLSDARLFLRCLADGAPRRNTKLLLKFTKKDGDCDVKRLSPGRRERPQAGAAVFDIRHPATDILSAVVDCRLTAVKTFAFAWSIA